MQAPNYRALVDRIRLKLKSWTGRFLSFAGRLQLLQSVVTGIVNFWLSAFKLPKSCIRQIDSLCAAFLWSGPDLNSRKAKMGWGEVCKPKQEGGLGLKNLSEVNIVCSLKLIWRSIATESIWAKWVRLYLLRGHCFWSPNISTSKGSWIWRSLLKPREIAKPLHRIVLGNGNLASFWFDNWSPLGRFYDHISSPGFIALGISEHSSVSDAKNLNHRRHQRATQHFHLMNCTEEHFSNLQPTKSDVHT